MLVQTIRAHFDGRVLVPVGPVDLPTGQLLEIEIRSVPAGRTDPLPGSPQAVLDAVDRLPRIPPEDLDELERAIESAKLPVGHRGVFDD